MTVSRTGYTGDLGYEVWVDAPTTRSRVWDAVWEAAAGHGVLPFGLDALYMLRIEAGLLLLDVDFALEPLRLDRRRPLDARSSSGSAGCSGTSPPTTARSSAATRSSASCADRTSRWRMTGLVVDWQDYDRVYDEAGLIPPKDHTPDPGGAVRVRRRRSRQVGYATSFMYSPMLQRHIALARVPPDLADAGHAGATSRSPSNHRYEHVDGAGRPAAALQPRAKDGLT